MKLETRMVKMFNDHMGTPVTLTQSIQNALDELLEQPFHLDVDQFGPIIEKHVKDFLSQHLTTAMNTPGEKNEILKLLWERITEK